MAKAPGFLPGTPECLDALIEALRFLLLSPDRSKRSEEQEKAGNGRIV